MAKLKRPSLTTGTKPKLLTPTAAKPKPTLTPNPAPSLSPKKATLTTPKLSKGTASLASKVKAKEVVEIAGEEVIFDEPANSYDTVEEKVQRIERILAAENLPVTQLKSGLKDVMTCIRDNEDSIMELSATDISTIVSGYMQLASEEERRIVEGAKPKTKKKKAPAKSARLKELEKLQQEIDVDSVDF